MSTDKTLADVKPGGRVRLGDALPPLPPEVDAVRCMIRGEKDLAEACDYYYTAEQMRDYARAALSAQPSQVAYHGDVDLKWLSGSIGEVAHRLSTYMPTGLAEWADRARDCRIAAQVLSELSAQPSPGGQGDLRSRFTAWVKANGYNPATFASGRYMGDGVQVAWEAVQALAARQPVVSNQSSGNSGELAVDGARQPVGEPVAYLDLGAGGYMDVGTDLSDEELAALPKGRHMLGIIGTYGVDGYKPAQAVDLGQFVPAERPLAYLKVATYHEAIGWNECRRSMLALIDSRDPRHG